MAVKKAPQAKARADVDPVLETQVRSLRAQAADEKKARLFGGQSKWMRPDPGGGDGGEWDGDLFDLQGMEQPFSRAASNDAFVKATRDPKAPGTTGDLVVTTLQADLLACMERAFRDRHSMRRPRATLHVLGRKAGHGHNKGPLTQAILEYVRGLVKQSKG